MTENILEEFKDDFPLFIEAGFIAVKQLDELSAKKIFTSAADLNSKSSAPQMGLGYIALNKLEVKEAIKIFQAIVEKEPENHLAKAFLAICFLLVKSKRQEGEKMIDEILKETDDPTVIHLGKIALEWADKDLKKEKSPFFAKGKEQKK